MSELGYTSSIENKKLSQRDEAGGKSLLGFGRNLLDVAALGVRVELCSGRREEVRFGHHRFVTGGQVELGFVANGLPSWTKQRSPIEPGPWVKKNKTKEKHRPAFEKKELKKQTNVIFFRIVRSERERIAWKWLVISWNYWKSSSTSIVDQLLEIR